MRFQEKTVALRDGEELLLRSPTGEDSETMLQYLRTACAETEYLLRTPEECTETEEQERAFLEGRLAAEGEMMIAAFAGERAVGSCQIRFHARQKTRHRAEVAIALISEYWGRGLGTILLSELIALARERGIHQVELTFIEGNDRGLALYKKLGFVITGEIPDAIRLSDGAYRKEYTMRLVL